MPDKLLKLMQKRHSARVLFDPVRQITKRDARKLLGAARWAPTAHNMQNFEIVMVEDKQLLAKIAAFKARASLAFVRENYQQLAFSVAELRKKKTGLLAAMFPPMWRKPNPSARDLVTTERADFLGQQIASSSALWIVLYDPKRRAPNSAHDFLGAISLGCMLENVWLMAEALGVSFHAVSALSGKRIEMELKRLLHIPERFQIAISFRLGYTTARLNYPRVRRDIASFAHFNGF